ncbi:hypothetical protein GCM10008905_01730 [Clostridium malenominatum]|uniref:ABC-2 family transporter protein n=1 Tax=Clostridium malenominatum TaxID=1539 RepID=A0ABN1ILF3_9CLOT
MMINWEVKKIFKSKNGIITSILFFILSISMIFIKPQLEGINNIQFWKVFNYRAFHPLMTSIMLIIIIIIFSNIYTDEIISTVDNLILSSRNKNKTLYSKLALSIGVPTVIYSVYLAMEFIITYIQCGKPINGGLQAIKILDNPLLVKDGYTIYGYVLLKIGIMLVIFMTLGVLASLFSFITTNSIQSTSGFLIFIFLGKVTTLIKWLPKEILLILSKINFIDLIFNFNEFAGMHFGRLKVFSMTLDITNLCLVIMVSTLFIAIFSCTNIFRKFLTR